MFHCKREPARLFLALPDNQLTPQPSWIYCEILGDIGARIWKEGERKDFLSKPRPQLTAYEASEHGQDYKEATIEFFGI